MKAMHAVVAEFDTIAEALAADPHAMVLTPAERFLLSQVTAEARRALDVGCGDGLLTRALAGRGMATLGLDASPRMIDLARARALGSPLLEYRVFDLTREALPVGGFDLVVSVAVAHHLPLRPLVAALRAAVAPGGTLLIQDVTTREGVRHLPANAAAWLARRLRILGGRDRRRPTLERLYRAHGEGETYLRHEEVEAVYRPLLPGARIHHHLEWRYTVAWRAPAS